MTGRLTAVCAVHGLLADEDIGVTAIDKRAVEGRLPVRALGLHGDVQADRRHHGGADKALYAYADEAAADWAAELGRDITPGLFGENLRTRGVDVDGAEIGERWRIGDGLDAVEVEVTMPRVPCSTFARRMGEQRWVKRFAASGHPGAYLRLVTAGTIAAGDAVAVVRRPGHGVTVGRWMVHRSADDARTLLRAAADGDLELAPDLVEYLQPAASRA